MRRPRGKRCAIPGVAGIVVVVIAVVGCSRSPEMKAASAGDAATLGRLIAAKEKAGTLTNRVAAELARVVADREVRMALGPDSVARVQDVRVCARRLDDALAARMHVHDAGGAAAALARVDSGTLSAETIRPFLTDAVGAWRAVGARGLIRREDLALRQRAFADPDPDVRRQAVRAARHAGDMSDLAALAEAARIDPEPSIRTEAVRALGALASPSGSRDVANALRDLWMSCDEPLREDIALAWSSPALWSVGGKEALRFVVETARGRAATQAAEAALRHPDVGADLMSEAVARLVEQISEGARAERLHALAVAPIDHAALMAAVTAASRDDDTVVRVAALARLAQAGRAIAVTQLEALAQPGSVAANRARFALALAGDRRVQLWLERSLDARDGNERLEAASALARLGVAARAAPLLVDPEPQVRMRVTCELMVADK
jgi:HEAT repeat protein